MILPNQTLKCGHTYLEPNCGWCEEYKQHIIQECDRCHYRFDSDAVYQSLSKTQLICGSCYHKELHEGGHHETITP